MATGRKTITLDRLDIQEFTYRTDKKQIQVVFRIKDSTGTFAQSGWALFIRPEDAAELTEGGTKPLPANYYEMGPAFWARVDEALAAFDQKLEKLIR